MTMHDIIRSLFGIWRLFLIDKRGIAFFDHNRERTIQSFIIPIITYSLIIGAMSLRVESYTGSIPLSMAMIVHGLGFIIGLCSYFLLTYSLIKYLKKTHEFMRYVQTSNWMAIIGFILILPVILIGYNTEPMVQFFFLMLMIFRKIYDWFIIQSIFEIQWYWILLILTGGEAIETIMSAMIYIIIY